MYSDLIYRRLGPPGKPIHHIRPLFSLRQHSRVFNQNKSVSQSNEKGLVFEKVYTES